MADQFTFDKELGPDYFIQLPVTIVQSTELSHGAYRLYSIFLVYCRQGATAWPGQKTLAGQLACSDRYIRSLLNELKEIGLLDWVTIWDPDTKKRRTTYHVRRLPLKQKRQPDSEAPAQAEPTDDSSVNIAQPPRNEGTKTNRKYSSASNRNYTSASHQATNRNYSSDESEGFKTSMSESHAVSDLLLPLFNKDRVAKLTAQVIVNGRNVHYVQEVIDYVAGRNDIANQAGYIRRMIEENQDIPEKRPRLSAQAIKERKKQASWQRLADRRV